MAEAAIRTSLSMNVRRQEASWGILDSVCKLIWFHDFGDHVESAHAVPYGDLELVSIEDSREVDASLLAFPGLNQTMPIL